MTSAHSDIAAELADRLVDLARHQAPHELRVACGLGGGGEPLVRELFAACGFTDLTVTCLHEANGKPPAVRYRATGDEGVITDYVAASGLAREYTRPAPCPDGSWRIALVRDQGIGETESQLYDEQARQGAFIELMARECRVARDSARRLAAELDAPTGLIADLSSLSTDWSHATHAELLRACVELPPVDRLRDELETQDGRAALDLGRALCLLEPSEIELSDELAMLASALSGRSYAVSDVEIVLRRVPALFEVTSDQPAVLRPSSGLARLLMLGLVPPSASEHYALFEALRERALTALTRRDASDRFVARQLPRQANAAGALHELVSDPLAVLSSDPFALLRELEHKPRELRMPAAKVVALSAHRLLRGHDRASQLELSARRIGLHEFAETLAERLPSRRWRPLWAQAEPTHTHRLAFNHRAPLLSVASVEHPEGWAFVGSADGNVWRVSPYRNPVQLLGTRDLNGEIRALAACRVGEDYRVGIGTSSHSVGMLDGRTGELLWLEESSHNAPISTATFSRDPQLTFITAGVDGKVIAHQLSNRSTFEVLYQHGSEVRDVRSIRLGDRPMAVFCAVDGVIGLLDLQRGEILAIWQIANDVLNSVDACVVDDDLILATGTSSGRVAKLTVPTASVAENAGAPRHDDWSSLARHALAVNRVHLVADRRGVSVLSGGSDGSWQWNNETTNQQVGLGHVGPIWSLDLMEAPKRRYVVSAGGEGTCRLWLTDAVLDERITHTQPLAHRGPVSAIEISAGPTRKTLVITGGKDGDVRVASPELTEGGELLARHDSEVSALLSVDLDGDQSHVVSGSLDGALRLTPVEATREQDSTILGIAHEGVLAIATARLGGVERLVSGGQDGTITAWDLDTRLPLETVQASQYGRVQAACRADHFSDEVLAVGDQAGVLRIYEGRLDEHSECALHTSILCLCSLPGAVRGLVVGLVDGRLAIVQEAGLFGQSVRFICASENEIRGLATLILGGRIYVACAGLDRHLRILDVHTGQEIIDIELDGYALSLSTLGSAAGIGSSAGAAVIQFPRDTLLLHQ
jgi:WD40 repeat protein